MRNYWYFYLMHRSILSFCVLLTACFSLSAQVNVLSFNIRYDNPDDGIHNWKYRKDKVASLIRYYEADIIGMQEVLKSQLTDLEKQLPGYVWGGVGRDDGVEAGEFSPVFYREQKFERLAGATFWLSETCDVPGKMGWDAACNRVVTWLKLKDRASSRVLYVFNTHFDHKGKTARLESAKLILQKIKEIAGSEPVVLTGDFNCTPGSEPYLALTAGQKLSDGYRVSETPPYGQKGTFNGFKVPEKDDERRIDMVFVTPAVRVLKHAVLTDSWGGKFPSDHFPVLVNLLLPGE